LCPLIIAIICTFNKFLTGGGGDACVRFSHSAGGIKRIRLSPYSQLLLTIVPITPDSIEIGFLP
jgi:hypothetical protein